MSLYLTVVYNVPTFFRKIEIKITQRVQKLVKKNKSWRFLTLYHR